MPLPNDFKQLPIWTLTDLTSKMPIDVNSLYFGLVENYSHMSTLQPLSDNMLKLTSDKFKPSPRMRTDDDWIIVDIEPNIDYPNIADHPYAKWAFDYLEYSKHNGLHGILRMPHEKIGRLTVYKDIDLRTEFIHEKHFITITGKEITTRHKDMLSHEESIAQIEKILELHQQYQVDSELLTSANKTLNRELTTKERQLLSTIKYPIFDQFVIDHNIRDDKSVRDIAYMESIIYRLMKKWEQHKLVLEKTQALGLLIKVINHTQPNNPDKLMLPMRKKHQQYRNYNNERITHREFLAIQAINYTFKDK